MKCLGCGQSLPTSENNSWHKACALDFFGTDQLPELNLSTKSLEQWAQSNVQAGITTPGVQRKMSLHLDLNQRPTRLTLMEYPAGYILKPPSTEYPYLPELEHALLLLANKALIPTVPFGLIQTSTNEVSFITKRIDRAGKRKIPMEDFCQLSGRLSEDKYRSSCEQCGKVIKRFSSKPGIDLTDFFYRILFCFISGNADMHLKNFSLYNPSLNTLNNQSGKSYNQWILAPAYDLLPTNLIIPDDQEESALTINGKRSKLQYKDFHHLGKSLDLPDKVILNLVNQLHTRFPLIVEELEHTFLPDPLKHQLKVLMETRLQKLQ